MFIAYAAYLFIAACYFAAGIYVLSRPESMEKVAQMTGAPIPMPAYTLVSLIVVGISAALWPLALVAGLASKGGKFGHDR